MSELGYLDVVGGWLEFFELGEWIIGAIFGFLRFLGKLRRKLLQRFCLNFLGFSEVFGDF